MYPHRALGHTTFTLIPGGGKEAPAGLDTGEWRESVCRVEAEDQVDN